MAKPRRDRQVPPAQLAETEERKLPGVPGHLQVAVQQLVSAAEPSANRKPAAAAMPPSGGRADE